MIERHGTFHVIAGKERDFETLLKKKYPMAMSRQAGFVFVSLLKEQRKEGIFRR